MNIKRLSSGFNANLGLLLLRVAVGIVFMAHGIAKLSNMTGTIAFFDSLGLGATMAWVVALIETIGGAMLILGLWTLIPSLLLVAVMIGAMTTAKWGKPFMGGYEFDFTLLMTLLAIAGLGSGKYALTKSSACGSCNDCDCSCHPGDKRCGPDGTCADCKCS
jgi:putative oxidoreductase